MQINVLYKLAGVRSRMERNMRKNFNTAQSGLSTRSDLIFGPILTKCDAKTAKDDLFQDDDAGMSIYLKRVLILRCRQTLGDAQAKAADKTQQSASGQVHGRRQYESSTTRPRHHAWRGWRAAWRKRRWGGAAQLDRTFIRQVERTRVNVLLDALRKLARSALWMRLDSRLRGNDSGSCGEGGFLAHETLVFQRDWLLGGTQSGVTHQAKRRQPGG